MTLYVIFAIILIIATILIVIIGVDVAFYFKNEIFVKYHIGRWDSYDSWHNAVKKMVKKWSQKTPTVRITDNERYILWDVFIGKYRSISIQSWQTASLILALNDSGEKELSKKTIKSYINKEGDWIKRPIAVDSGLLSYSLMKSVDDVNAIKPAMDYMINIVLSYKDSFDVICYNKDNTNPEKYVDTLGLVCPFLTYYAKLYNKPEYEILAYKQLEFYHNFGLIDNNLPNHAINSNTYEPLGVYGWGRGVAWYLIGLMGTYIESENVKVKATIENWIMESADSYMVYQREDGGFGSIIQRKSTYDSSATAFFAYFYGWCYNEFKKDEYMSTAKKCLNKLKSVTRRNGALDYCQGDTKDIGIFAQYYDIMPFAQGYTLRAIEIIKDKFNG